MSGEVVGLIQFVLCIVAYGVYRYFRSPNVNKSSTESKSAQDPFLQQIASEKARIDKNASAAQLQHERELEERFAQDIQLKERLSQFAKDMELDKALIALWEEKECELRVSTQDLDFETWNRLQMSGISECKAKDTESVEFLHGTQQFKVVKRVQGYEYDLFAYFSLWEDNEEVFTISCSVNPDGYGYNKYSGVNVSAFKKQGNWVKILLEYYKQIKIQEAKADPVKYWGAKEIKSRFKE